MANDRTLSESKAPSRKRERSPSHDEFIRNSRPNSFMEQNPDFTDLVSLDVLPSSPKERKVEIKLSPEEIMGMVRDAIEDEAFETLISEETNVQDNIFKRYEHLVVDKTAFSNEILSLIKFRCEMLTAPIPELEEIKSTRTSAENKDFWKDNFPFHCERTLKNFNFPFVFMIDGQPYSCERSYAINFINVETKTEQPLFLPDFTLRLALIYIENFKAVFKPEDVAKNIETLKLFCTCPITKKWMREPVIASDGFTYEKTAIQMYYTQSKLSPRTGELFQNTLLLPSVGIKKLQTLVAPYLNREMSVEVINLKELAESSVHGILLLMRSAMDNCKLADDLFNKNLFEAALANYSIAHKSVTQSVSIKNKIALCHEKLGQTQHAIDAYNTSIKINPLLSITYSLKAVYLVSLKNYSHAAEAYERALKLNPNLHEYIELGAIYFKLGNAKKALENYECAIKIDPKNVMVFNRIGYILKRNKHFQKALEYHEHALKLNPHNLDTIYSRGSVLLELKRYPEALIDLMAFCAANPKDAYAGLKKAIAQEHSGQHQAALQTYVELIDLEPKNSNFYLQTARIYHVTGKPKESLECFNYAIVLNPERAESYLMKAQHFNTLKDYVKARELYQAQLMKEPTNQYIISQLAIISKGIKNLSGSPAFFASSSSSSMTPIATLSVPPASTASRVVTTTLAPAIVLRSAPEAAEVQTSYENKPAP